MKWTRACHHYPDTSEREIRRGVALLQCASGLLRMSPELPSTNTAQTVVTPEPPPYTWEEFEQEPTFPISFFLISILAYLIAVGPLDYFLTRLFRRPWLTWVTLPLWAILFTTLFYHAGRFLNLENPENSRFYREEITIAASRASAFASGNNRRNSFRIRFGTNRK